MVPFIATVFPQRISNASPVEGYRVIVLARHRESAERAIQAYLDRTSEKLEYTIAFEGAWASPEFLKAAQLRPGEVRRFDP